MTATKVAPPLLGSHDCHATPNCSTLSGLRRTLRWLLAPRPTRGGSTWRGCQRGPVHGRGVHAEGVGDLAAVDDEGFFELVLHLRQFPQSAVDMPATRYIHGYISRSVAADLLAVDDIDDLPGGASVQIAGHVPHLAGRVLMLAEHGDAFADVGDVGVGVGLVEVAELGARSFRPCGGNMQSPRLNWAPPRGPKSSDARPMRPTRPASWPARTSLAILPVAALP